MLKTHKNVYHEKNNQCYSIKLFIPRKTSMKRILPILLSLTLVSCGTAKEALSILPADSSYPMGVAKDFLTTFEHTDLGSTGMRSVAQSGKYFVMYFKDDTTGQKAVCDNLDEKVQCIDSVDTTLAEDSTDTIVRVTAKSVRRLIAREHSITSPDNTETITPPTSTQANTADTLFAPFEAYAEGKKNLSMDYCVVLSQNSAQESESLCYAGELVSSYVYIQGSSIIPLMIQRTLHFYKDQTLTQEELRSLKSTMITEMKK